MCFSLPYEIKTEVALDVFGYDGILFISSSKPGTDGPELIKLALTKAYEVNIYRENKIIFEINLIYANIII